MDYEPHGNPSRPPSRHRIPLRSRGDPFPPRHPPAALRPFADAGAGVFAEHRAGEPLHQLAAGPLRQLGGAVGVPGEDPQVPGGGRSGGGPDGDQSLRLLPREGRRGVSLPVSGGSEARAGTLSEGPRERAAADGVAGDDPARDEADGGLPGRCEFPRAPGGRLRDPAGARGADLRADLRARHRVVPGLGVFAGPGVAPPRVGGALRVGLPGPVEAGPGVARRAVRAEGGLHRSPCVDGGLHPGCGVDRAGSHFRVVRRGRAHPTFLHAGAGQRRAGGRRCGRVRDGIHLGQRGDPRPRGSAGDQALFRHRVGGDRRAGREGRRAAGGRRRGADDGRRADLRVDRRHGGTGVEFHRRQPGEARAGAGVARQAQGRLRPWRPASLRRGQVVSG